jgi:hypothetical protein
MGKRLLSKRSSPSRERLPRDAPASPHTDDLAFEAQRWNDTYDRMVAMMAPCVGIPKIPVDTPANRRLALEELSAILCRRDEDAQAVMQKYAHLKGKYRRTKAKLGRVHAHCEALGSEIERTRQRLAGYAARAHRHSHSAIDARLGRLEEMLEVQIEAHERLLANSRALVGRVRPQLPPEARPRSPLRA